ncbi:MAG TPA: Plug domain-containing protein [Gemmatimonadaceae bacterium]|nr:Plug domain-containing protein [Gemmatimonadaceae bacterium]
MRSGIARLTRATGTLALAGWLGACATSGGPPPATSSSPPPEGRIPTSATVITGTDLTAANRPLLDVLRQRLPGMQVHQTGGCPEIVLRGKSTINTSSSPAIYVDGNQATNTCILNELRTADISQVEIYPGGVPPRAGYRAHPYGVILIFIKRV